MVLLSLLFSLLVYFVFFFEITSSYYISPLSSSLLTLKLAKREIIGGYDVSGLGKNNNNDDIPDIKTKLDLPYYPSKDLIVLQNYLKKQKYRISWIRQMLFEPEEVSINQMKAVMALTLSSLYDNNNNNNNINNNINNNDDILLSLLNNLIDNKYDNDDIMINDIQNIINTLLSDEESISLSVILSQIRDQEDEEAQIALIEAENDKDDIVIINKKIDPSIKSSVHRDYNRSKSRYMQNSDTNANTNTNTNMNNNIINNNTNIKKGYSILKTPDDEEGIIIIIIIIIITIIIIIIVIIIIIIMIIRYLQKGGRL